MQIPSECEKGESHWYLHLFDRKTHPIVKEINTYGNFSLMIFHERDLHRKRLQLNRQKRIGMNGVRRYYSSYWGVCPFLYSRGVRSKHDLKILIK